MSCRLILKPPVTQARMRGSHNLYGGNMKLRLALIATFIAAFLHAADTSPFYDLTALRKLIASPGPQAADARGNMPLMYAALDGTWRVATRAHGFQPYFQ